MLSILNAYKKADDNLNLLHTLVGDTPCNKDKAIRCAYWPAGEWISRKKWCTSSTKNVGSKILKDSLVKVRMIMADVQQLTKVMAGV